VEQAGQVGGKMGNFARPVSLGPALAIAMRPAFEACSPCRPVSEDYLDLQPVELITAAFTDGDADLSRFHACWNS
jgi:hypothetical protein